MDRIGEKPGPRAGRVGFGQLSSGARILVFAVPTAIAVSVAAGFLLGGGQLRTLSQRLTDETTGRDSSVEALGVRLLALERRADGVEAIVPGRIDALDTTAVDLEGRLTALEGRTGTADAAMREQIAGLIATETERAAGQTALFARAEEAIANTNDTVAGQNARIDLLEEDLRLLTEEGIAANAQLNDLREILSELVVSGNGFVRVGDIQIAWGTDLLSVPLDGQHTRWFSFSFPTPYSQVPIVVYAAHPDSNGYAFVEYQRDISLTDFSGRLVEVEFRPTTVPVRMEYFAVGRWR